MNRPVPRGHPAGLYVLFMTETWAHFSYYGMQAMLVYYMTKQLGFSQPHASLIYGGYVAYAYLTPLLGGWLADRWLGQRRSVIFGGAVMALGHFALAFEVAFFPGLALVGLGNGFFMTSTTTQVGHLYPPGDARLDRAYSVYYVGINIGAFLAPLVCGTLGELYGWHYGFVAAGVGMLIGLVIYLGGQRTLAPERGLEARRAGGGLTDADRGAIRALLLVALIVVLFRVGYEQSGNTIAIWADANTDRRLTLLGRSVIIPATWFQSINPFLIFTLTPVVAWRWARQAEAGREPAPLAKMSIGCLIGGSAFLVMIGAALDYQATGAASWLWLVAFFALLTAGELFVLPIGLSLFSRLAPVPLTSAMIGLWYLAKFAGGLLAGAFGALWQDVNPVTFFAISAAAAFVAAALLRAVEGRAGGSGLR